MAQENTLLIVTVLKPEKTERPIVNEDRAALIRSLKGSMWDSLSSVDEFIAHKQEEIDLDEGG